MTIQKTIRFKIVTNQQQIMTESTLYLPEEIAAEVSEFPYDEEGREIQGAFIFGDRERYEGEDNIDDTFVASYVITGIGDETSVRADEDQLEALETLRETEQLEINGDPVDVNFDYRMFHTHPYQTMLETGQRPDVFSPQDMESTEYRQKRVNNGNYYDILVAPSPQQGKKAVFKPSDERIDVQTVGTWEEDDGTSWRGVEEEIDRVWNKIGGKVKSP